MTTLVCYDGSPSAQRALQVAHNCLDHQPVVLLHVWNPPERIHPDSFGMGDSHGPSYEQLVRSNEERAAEIASEGQRLAASLDIAAVARVERSHSSVWQTILDVADELDSELIVTGTHGGTAVTARLLGSVSNALIHNSPRPVLIVPHSTVTNQLAQSTAGSQPRQERRAGVPSPSRTA